MTYKNLHIFGDSFSTPGFMVEPEHSYWGLLKTHLSIPNVYNYSFVRNAWEGVLHSVIGNPINFAQDLLIIAIPPLERRMKFDDFKGTVHEIHHYGSDWQADISSNISLSGLDVLGGFSGPKGKTKRGDIDLLANRSWVETVLFRELFLLTQWLNRSAANYLIINTCGKDLDSSLEWGPSTGLLDCVFNNKYIVTEDNYHGINEKLGCEPADYNEHGWIGHHGREGNQNFFEKSLLEDLSKAKLI